MSDIKDIRTTYEGSGFAVLTANGDVYVKSVFRYSDFTRFLYDEPLTMIPELKNIVNVAISNGFAGLLAVTTSGQVYSLPDIRKKPVLVAGLSNIVKVAAAKHNLALSDDGKVYSWGEGSSYRNLVKSEYLNTLLT